MPVSRACPGGMGHPGVLTTAMTKTGPATARPGVDLPEHRETRVCLIGGTGRSGTTLLTRILARHRDLTDVPEWRFLIDPDGIADFYRNRQAWSPYHAERRLRRLEGLLKRVDRSRPGALLASLAGLVERHSPVKLTPAYGNVTVSHHCPGYRRHVRALMDELTNLCFVGSWVGMEAGERRRMRYQGPPEGEVLAQTFGGFLHKVMAEVMDRQGATHYLEKNTWNILWFDTLRELMPEARLVHIYRDPRDVVASFATQRWMPSSHAECAVIYDHLMGRWQEVKARVPRDAYREYSLEALVAEPERTLREVCDFWGLPWQPDLVDVDLGRANSGRWRDDIPAPARAQVEAQLAPWLKAYGYAP